MEPLLCDIAGVSLNCMLNSCSVSSCYRHNGLFHVTHVEGHDYLVVVVLAISTHLYPYMLISSSVAVLKTRPFVLVGVCVKG